MLPEESERSVAAGQRPEPTSTAPISEVGLRTRRLTAQRLLPFLFCLYIVAFLDRMNVSAAALQMPGDLGFSERTVGFGAGVFFVGYFLFAIPGALIAERWSARLWIARIMIAWGMLTVLMAFIHTSGQFYLVRFLVGAAESGFFPAVIVYLTHWFRAADRAKAVAAFYAAMPLSYVVGSPIAGVFLGLSWFGLRGWRWLFILEGIPAVILGLVTLYYLTDWPREAGWLRAEEREWITTQLDEEKKAKKAVFTLTIWQAFRHRDVILLTLCYFFAVTGNYGIAFWLPTILKRLSGATILTVTLLSALPYLVGFLTQQLNGWHSDLTGERRWHSAIPIFLSGVSLWLAISVGANDTAWSLFFYTLVGGAYYAYGPAFWAVPTEFLSESAAAVSIGLINSVGNLGGFVGPFVVGYLVTQTKSFHVGLWYLVGSFLVSAALMLAVGTGRWRFAEDSQARSSSQINVSPARG
jgi:ACS family tartrate transporter-like MFS transporter